MNSMSNESYGYYFAKTKQKSHVIVLTKYCPRKNKIEKLHL